VDDRAHQIQAGPLEIVKRGSKRGEDTVAAAVDDWILGRAVCT
jgi:hypothetical protein